MLAVIGVVLTVLAPLVSEAEESRLRLDYGHVDAFNVALDDSGAPFLNLKEDVTGSHVPHDPATVDLVVKEDARLTLPEASAIPAEIQGKEGYYLPLNQDHNLLWPGWDSQQLLGSDYDAVDIVIDSIDGPGDVHIWSNGPFGNILPLMVDAEGNSTTLAPATIRQTYFAHVHANWFFSEPGKYHFNVYAIAYDSDTGESVRTNSATYQFTVGDLDPLTAVSIEGGAESYAPGDTIELSAVTDPATIEGVSYTWETVVDGEWTPIAGAHDQNYIQKATVDQQIRVVATLNGATVTSDPVEIVVAEPTMPTSLLITGLDNPYEEGELAALTAEPDVDVDGATYRWEVSTNGQDWQADESMNGPTWTGDAVEQYVRATLMIDGADIVTSDAQHILVEEPAALPNSLVLQGLKDQYEDGESVSLTADPDVDVEGATYRWETSTGDKWSVDNSSNATSWTGKASANLRIRATLVLDHADIVTSDPVTITLAPTEEPEQERQCYGFDLDRGHVDAFNVMESQGALLLTLKEDVTGTGVVRAPSDVNLVVKESALMELPAVPAVPSAIQGAKGYYLPITQDQNLLWPGWNSQSLAGTGYDTVDISIESVNGPGDVHIWGGATATGFQHLVYDGKGNPVTQLPATIKQDYLAHVHANWFFTKPGTYRLTVKATAHNSNTGKSAETNSQEYIVSVGAFDRDDADYACPNNSIIDIPDGEISDGEGPAKGNGSVNDNPGGSTPAGTNTAGADATPSLANPNQLKATPQSSGGSSTSSHEPVCLPLDHPDAAKKGSASVTPSGDSDSGSNGENQATATSPTPAGVIGREGHFDFGPALENGSYAMKVKDDRTAPPVWRDAEDVVFKLGDKAKRSKGEIPEELSFIADGSQDVWMIQQIQEPGVPWIGWNTQHETIVNGPGSNGVDMTLVSVDGPGELAIFLNGPFGQLVGQRVVDTVGGPTTYRIPANTHQHGNWVFTKPGNYKVTFTLSADGKSVTDTLTFAVGVPATAPAGGDDGSVSASGASADQGASTHTSNKAQTDSRMGVTPEGDPCVLNSGALAHAGTPFDIRPAVASGLLFVLTGGLLTWQVKRRKWTLDA